MSYQNVSTPRFYVSILQFLNHFNALNGSFSSNHFFGKNELELVSLNPAKQGTFNVPSGTGGDFAISYSYLNNSFSDIMPKNKNFKMILGHNFSNVKVFTGKGSDYANIMIAEEPLVNYVDDSQLRVERNGFSIAKGNDADDLIDNDSLKFIIRDYVVGNTYKLGSLLYGTYYDMPVSPNLSLKLSYKYGGIDELTAYNGATHTNQNWHKPPSWGDGGAWELYDNESQTESWDGTVNLTDKVLSRSGRKSWDLSFSYISDSDIFGSNQSLSDVIFTDTNYESEDIAGGDSPYFKYSLLTDDNFFSQVWHKTLGGALPFVFQPDNLNKNPDQFAICKFVDNSLKIDQTAFNVYDISLKIEEVW